MSDVGSRRCWNVDCGEPVVRFWTSAKPADGVLAASCSPRHDPQLKDRWTGPYTLDEYSVLEVQRS